MRYRRPIKVLPNVMVIAFTASSQSVLRQTRTFWDLMDLDSIALALHNSQAARVNLDLHLILHFRTRCCGSSSGRDLSVLRTGALSQARERLSGGHRTGKGTGCLDVQDMSRGRAEEGLHAEDNSQLFGRWSTGAGQYEAWKSYQSAGQAQNEVPQDLTVQGAWEAPMGSLAFFCVVPFQKNN